MLVSLLNRQKVASVIKDIQVINNGFTLAFRHKEGVSFWDVKQTRADMLLNSNLYGISDFLISKDRGHVTYCNQYRQIVKNRIDDSSSWAQIAPEDVNIGERVIMNDGDLLFKSNIYFDHEGGDKDRSSPSLYSLCFWDLNTIIRNSASRKKRTQRSLEDVELRSKIKRMSIDVYSNLRNVIHPGKHVLLELNEDITCFSIICNKDLDMPYIFENHRVVSNLQFYSNPDNRERWEGDVRLGTVNGNCYNVKFTVDEAGVLSRRLIQVFSRGTPLRNPPTHSAKLVPDLGKRKMTLGGLSNPQVFETNPGFEDVGFTIHDFKKFYKESLEIVFMAKKTTRNGQSETTFEIHFKFAHLKNWVYEEFHLEHFYTLSSSTFFKVYRMENSDDDDFLRFYFKNYLGVGTFSICKRTHALQYNSFFEKNISESTHLVYSHSLDVFIFVVNNSIELWTSCLKIFIHKIELDSEIIGVYLCEGPRHSRLMVYEQTRYSELDLLDFNLLCSQKLVKKKNRGLLVPIHGSLIETKHCLHLPFFRRGVAGLTFSVETESFDLFTFPFHPVPECFSKHNYKKNVLIFAEYYFETIGKNDYIDSTFGPLNPFLMAISQNDITLVEQLLERFRYPKEVKGYFSPLSFAFKYGYCSAVQIFCQQLAVGKYTVNFSRMDFHFLLASDLVACHDLVRSIPQLMGENQFPSYMSLSKRGTLYNCHNLIHLLIRLRRREFRKKILLKDVEDKKQKKKLEKKLNIKQREIRSVKIPFKYSFETGTFDSITFLEKMTFSQSTEFVTSEWKEVVEHKWRQMYWVMALKAILFGVHMTFIFVRAFMQDAAQEVKDDIKIGFLACWIFFFSYMVVEMVAYGFFNLLE